MVKEGGSLVLGFLVTAETADRRRIVRQISFSSSHHHLHLQNHRRQSESCNVEVPGSTSFPNNNRSRIDTSSTKISPFSGLSNLYSIAIHSVTKQTVIMISKRKEVHCRNISCVMTLLRDPLK